MLILKVIACCTVAKEHPITCSLPISTRVVLKRHDNLHQAWSDIAHCVYIYFRSWSRTLFWKPLAMLRQSGMTTRPGLANLSSFNSTRQAESAAQQSGRICWKDHELFSLQILSATTIYSIRSAILQKGSAP